MPEAGAGRVERFVGAVVAEQPAKKEIDIILDNLSTHKTKRVRDFLAVGCKYSGGNQVISRAFEPGQFVADSVDEC